MGRKEVNTAEGTKAARWAELGGCSDERLAAAMARYGFPVEILAGGKRYSMIQAIMEWEAETGGVVWELTKRVDDLSERPEIMASRNLTLLYMESRELSERHQGLLRESYLVTIMALYKTLLDEGFSEREVEAAVVKRALTWG